MRKNKPQIPNAMQPTRQRPVHSSIFGFEKDIAMVSYVPKLSKAVILISTLHHQPEIGDDSEEKKPKMILDYNHSKAGVDTLDQLVRYYSCKRKTNRWPMAVFSSLLDVAAYNALVLFTSVHPQYMNGASNRRRRSFLLELGKSLLPNNNMTHQSKNALMAIAAAPTVEEAGPKSYARCAFCPRNMDKKTSNQCARCQLRICKQHQQVVCLRCSSSNAVLSP
jgi:hypothetical protein